MVLTDLSDDNCPGGGELWPGGGDSGLLAGEAPEAVTVVVIILSFLAPRRVNIPSKCVFRWFEPR